MFNTKSISLAAVILAVSLTAAGPLQGQTTPAPLTRTQFGLGYVGNAPDALVGGSAYVLVPEIGPLDGGIGLYVDVKLDYDTPKSDREFNSSLTVQELLADPNRDGADFTDSEDSYMSVNVALVRPLTPYLMAYVGGGMTTITRYERYNLAPSDPAGVGGLVVLENPEMEQTKANFMVGIFMRVSSVISTQFGFETQPQGVTVGASLRLPRW